MEGKGAPGHHQGATQDVGVHPQDIIRLWVTRMDDSYLKALVESMLRRMAKVLEREGAMTKY